MKDEELVQRLLTHDEDVAIPAAHERRIREGLGALLAAAPTSGSTQAAREPLADAPAATAARGALGKWLTTGLVAVVAAGGGFAVGRATAPQYATPTPVASPVATVAAPPPSETEAAAPIELPAPAPPPAAAPPTPVASPVPAPQDTFDREQSLLERARSALVRHDADAADKTLDEHERLFPRSRHAEERDYLRIQVLRERGDKARLSERAKAFIVKYPDSMLRRRVESLTE